MKNHSNNIFLNILTRSVVQLRFRACKGDCSSNGGSSHGGYTLVELMIATFISLILVIAIYAGYNLQSKTQTTQDLTISMQQNIRAAATWFLRDIRQAGYDRKGPSFDMSCEVGGMGANVTPGIHTATATTFGFSMDLDEDGTCATSGENITYSLSVAGELVRGLPGGSTSSSVIAENFEALEFNYVLADGSSTLTPTLAQRGTLLAVQISLLARSEQRDPKFDNQLTVYTPASGAAQNWGPYGDNIRRKLFATSIQLRNI